MAILRLVAQVGVVLALCGPTKPAAGSLQRRKYKAKFVFPGAGNITRISITRESEILLRNTTWIFSGNELENIWLTDNSWTNNITTLKLHYVRSLLYHGSAKLNRYSTLQVLVNR